MLSHTLNCTKAIFPFPYPSLFLFITLSLSVSVCTCSNQHLYPVWSPRTLTLVSDSVCTQPVNTNVHMQMPLYLLSVTLVCSKAWHIWFPQNKSNFWTKNPFFLNRILVSMGIWQWNCHLWWSESLVWLIERKQLFRQNIMLQSFSLTLEQTRPDARPGESSAVIHFKGLFLHFKNS